MEEDETGRSYMKDWVSNTAELSRMNCGRLRRSDEEHKNVVDEYGTTLE
jgi:hypothetical protein